MDQSKAMMRLSTIKQRKFKYKYASGNVSILSKMEKHTKQYLRAMMNY